MIKIQDLTPNIRGNHSIVFEVVKIVSTSQNKQELTCRVADDTGIVTIYFNQLGNLIKEGDVLQINNFKCRVFDHHLRLETIKQTTFTKLPTKIKFKDLTNDLSLKFYVQKDGPLKNDKPNYKQESQKQVKKNQKQIQQQNVQEKIPEQKIKEERTKQEKTSKVQNKPKLYKPKPAFEQKNPTVIFRQKTQKNQAQKKNGDHASSKKHFVPKEQKRILLRDLPKYWQKSVDLRVQVQLKGKIVKEKYFLCRVADSSGSAYLEFNVHTKLQDQSWYNLYGFTVYADKVYGFIAAQQEKSSLQIQQENYEVADNRQIKFK